MKRYLISCEHDNRLGGQYESDIGFASTLKSAKASIRGCRRNSELGLDLHKNPHNFKVWDLWSDEEVIPAVYCEA